MREHARWTLGRRAPIPDEFLYPLMDLIDEAIEHSGPTAKDKADACTRVRVALTDFTRRAGQCRECGSLYVDRETPDGELWGFRLASPASSGRSPRARRADDVVTAVLRHDGVLALCLDLPGAWPDQPWGDGTVTKVGTRPGKIFAFPGTDPPSVAVKLPPDDAVELRAAYPTAVGDAPYLSKKHWVRVLLDGTVSDDEVRELFTTSYDLVVAALPSAQRPG